MPVPFTHFFRLDDKPFPLKPFPYLLRYWAIMIHRLVQIIIRDILIPNHLCVDPINLVSHLPVNHRQPL